MHHHVIAAHERWRPHDIVVAISHPPPTTACHTKSRMRAGVTPVRFPVAIVLANEMRSAAYNGSHCRAGLDVSHGWPTLAYTSHVVVRSSFVVVVVVVAVAVAAVMH